MVPEVAVSSLTILGSGTCVPSLKRSSCAVLLETGVSKILFDAGAGTMRRLLEAGIRIFDISHIFFSHFHPDHTAEIVPFLFATKYPEVGHRRLPIIIAAGRGFGDFFGGLRRVFGHWIDLPDHLLELVEFDNTGPDRMEFKGFDIKTMPVEHNPESIAYRITLSSGKTVVYSGDTDYCENLIDLAENADVFICESSFPDAMKARGHLTPSLAGDIAARAGVHRLILTHFYPECDTMDIDKECRMSYGGPLILAEDLQTIEF